MSEWNGIPENPEQDGWHWLAAQGCEHPWHWSQEEQGWRDGDRDVWLMPIVLPAEGWAYLGVGLTPAEVAAREAAAAEAMREACAAFCNTLDADDVEDQHGAKAREMAAALRDEILTIPLPAPDALARVRAEAKREGMEEAARIADRVQRDFSRIAHVGALGAALTRDEIRAAAIERAKREAKAS